MHASTAVAIPLRVKAGCSTSSPKTLRAPSTGQVDKTPIFSPGPGASAGPSPSISAGGPINLATPPGGSCQPVDFPGQKPASEVSRACIVDPNYSASCWADLQLKDWIPAWVKSRKPCAATRSRGVGGLNSWTHAFLSKVDGPTGARDCSGLENDRDCPSIQFVPRCGGSDAILNARYRYVAYAIVCE